MQIYTSSVHPQCTWQVSTVTPTFQMRKLRLREIHQIQDPKAFLYLFYYHWEKPVNQSRMCGKHIDFRDVEI